MRVTDKPLGEIAKDLGVSAQTLRNWRRQAPLAAGSARSGVACNGYDEVRDPA